MKTMNSIVTCIKAETQMLGLKVLKTLDLVAKQRVRR